MAIAGGEEAADNRVSRPWRIAWLVLVAAHLVLTAAWWWWMPHGFPVGHPRWWVNELLPPVVFAGCALAIAFARFERWAPAAWLGAGLGSVTIAGALVGRAVFPVSAGSGRWLAVLAVGAAWWWLVSRVPGLRWTWLALAVAIAAAVGAWLPMSQLAPPAGTNPRGAELAQQIAGSSTPRTGTPVFLSVGGLHVTVNPVLRLDDRSLDRGWTILTPAPERVPPALESVVRVDDSRTDLIRIDACSRVPPPGVWSHLESWCEVAVDGLHRPTLVFSPCPDVSFEPLPSDYPTGRPLQFACVDATGVFRVLRCADAEKGPFEELASSRVDAAYELAITVCDEGVPVLRITLRDWVAQSDRRLSPTAGWGVPVNNLRFERSGSEPTSRVLIGATLAGTGIGRGWDSVGHTPGWYACRLVIEPLNRPD